MNQSLTKNSFRNTIISMLCTIAIGIIFIAKPDILAKVCVVAGILIAIGGAVMIAAYFLGNRENGSQMVYGCLMVGGGILLSIIPSLLNFLVPLLFGVWVLLSGASGVYRNFSLRRVHRTWWIGLLLCAAVACLGVFLITRSFRVVETTTMLIGIALVVHGVLRLAAVIMARHY